MIKKCRAISALTILLVIIFLIQPIAQVPVVKANFYPFGLPKIDVRSPHSSPYVYVKSNVDISFDYHVPNTQVDSFSYSLDGNANSTLNILKTANIYYYDAVNYTVFKALENLANGNHKIIVYAHFSNNTVSPILSSTITVDTTFIPPIPFMISPLNQTTYNTKQVPLIYTINSKILWSYYSLDDSGWKPFSGNITLPNLSEGQHKIKLVVTTESRQTTTYSDSAQTVIFKANPSISNPISIEPTLPPTPVPTSTPTLTTPYLPPNDRNAPHLEPTFYLLPISVIIAIIVIAIIIYRRGRLASKQSFL